MGRVERRHADQHDRDVRARAERPRSPDRSRDVGAPEGSRPGLGQEGLRADARAYELLADVPGALLVARAAAHALRPPHLGHSAAGFITAAPGLAKGLSVAIGCWWEDKTYKAICLFDEEATSRPVAAHMLQFAKTAVPHVLG